MKRNFKNLSRNLKKPLCSFLNFPTLKTKLMTWKSHKILLELYVIFTTTSFSSSPKTPSKSSLTVWYKIKTNLFIGMENHWISKFTFYWHQNLFPIEFFQRHSRLRLRILWIFRYKKKKVSEVKIYLHIFAGDCLRKF